MRTLTLLLFTVACGSSSETSKPPDGSGEGETGPADTDTDPTQGLPSIAGAEDNPGGCEEISGVAIPGAASVLYGEYWTDGDGTWSGEERWMLYSNAAWRAAGGEDCEVVWTAAASGTSPPACTGCDLGLEATLTIDNGATTCDLDLVSGLGNTATYGIARTSDGDAAWYFAGSGDWLGDGYHISTAMNFLTDPSCRWW
jgi:hypothetical protein